MILNQGKLMDPRIIFFCLCVKVLISSAREAESLVACAMTKRATAMTNANSTSRCCALSFGSFLKKALCMAVCMISYCMLCKRVNSCLVGELNHCHIIRW